MDYSPHRRLCYRSLIMAVILILIGIQSQISLFGDGFHLTWRQWLHSLSGFILVLFGSLMLLPRFRNIMSAIGLMCVGIGISRAIVSISNTLQSTNIYNLDGLMSIGMALFGYITMWFALYQIYRGTNFLRGNAMNAFIMRFTSIGIVILYIAVVVYAGQFFDIPFTELWKERSDFLTSPILYSMYFILLCSSEAFDYMDWEKTRVRILNIAAPTNPGLLMISDAERARLSESIGNPDSWQSPDNGSPVERELRIQLKSATRPMEIVLRKWFGSDNIYLTLVPGGGREFIASVHGILTDVEFLEGCISFVGSDHPLFTVYAEDFQSGQDNISIGMSGGPQ